MKRFFDFDLNNQEWGGAASLGLAIGIVALMFLHLPIQIAGAGCGIAGLLLLFFMVF